MADGSRGPKGFGRGQNICVKEEFKIAVKIALDKFRYDESQKELEFPSSFNSVERAYIHRLCQNLGLKSKSKGKGNTRFLTVTNKDVKGSTSCSLVKLSSNSCQYIDNVMKKFPLNTKEKQDLQPRTDRLAGPTCSDLGKGYKDAKFMGKLSSTPPQMPAISRENDLTVFRRSLPIWGQRSEIIKLINENQVVLISGETGSGKTTQVPQFIMENSITTSTPCRLVCTQPRRISAMSVAERVSAERGERIGHTVGYQIRLESRVSPKTLLTYCTNGVLLRTLMQGDNSLSFITHIIVDEIHERDRFSDFLLISLRDILSVNKKIKLVLMSAALDINLFIEYFGKCPVVHVPGRCFEVKELFLEDALNMTSYRNKGMERHMKESGKASFVSAEIKKDLDFSKPLSSAKEGSRTKEEFKSCPGLIHLPPGPMYKALGVGMRGEVGELADEEPDNDADVEIEVFEEELELQPAEDEDAEQKIAEDSQEKDFDSQFQLEDDTVEEDVDLLLAAEDDLTVEDDQEDIVLEDDEEEDKDGDRDVKDTEECIDSTKSAGTTAGMQEGSRNHSQEDSDEDDYLRQEMDDSISEAWLKGHDDSFVQILHLIMNENISVDYQHSETQATALMVAAGRGCVGVVEQLLSLGANPHIREPKNGWTAMDWAKKWDHAEVIEQLYSYLASPRVSYSDDISLENQSNELSEENKELLAVYHKTFDDDRVDLNLITSLMTYICDSERQGAILVFLPGYDEIITLRDRLASDKEFGNTRKYQLFTLHSSMQPSEQRKVFRKLPSSVRKIIMSTNIAETSVTIDDVVFVIDSGKVKEKSFDALTSVSTLQTVWISKANAIQRRGRAGRCSPGVCFHLFSRVRYDSLQPYQVPELLRIPLQELCLHTKLLAGPSTSIADFLSKAPEPPAYLVLRNAVTLLKTIDALDKWEDLTDLGRHLVDLPVEPRLGKMILYSVILKCIDPVITIACTLAYRNPFILPMYASEKRAAALAKKKFILDPFSDHLLFVKAFRGWQRARAEGFDRSYCQKNYLSPATLEMMAGMRSQILGHLKSCGFIRPRGAGDIRDLNTNSNNWAVVKAALCAGVYPQIARVDRNENKLTTPKESKVRLHTSSVVYQPSERKESHSSAQTKAVTKLPSDWLIYEEMTRMYTCVTVKCCTVVLPITVALFSGPSLSSPNLCTGDNKSCDTDRRNSEGRRDSESSDSETEENKTGNVSRDSQAEIKMDEWISMTGNHETIDLACYLRHKLQALFIRRIRAPARPWSQVDETVIRAVVSVLSAEEEIINPNLYPKQRTQRPGLESSVDSRNRVDRTRPTERFCSPRERYRDSGPSSRSKQGGSQSPQTVSRRSVESSPGRASPQQDKLSEARFFIMKCNNQRNLDISMAKGLRRSVYRLRILWTFAEPAKIAKKSCPSDNKQGIWATTIANEKKLNRAFRESKRVVLIFSVQGSGHFQGFAHMTSPIGREKSPEFGSSSLGGVFTVDWIKKANIPFQHAHHLVNPWNDHKKVQISRDGQELEPTVGGELSKIWDSDPSTSPARYARPLNGPGNNNRRTKPQSEPTSVPGQWQGLQPAVQQSAAYPAVQQVYAPHTASMPIPVPVPSQHSRHTIVQAYTRPPMATPQPVPGRAQSTVAFTGHPVAMHPHMRTARYPSHVVTGAVQPPPTRTAGPPLMRPSSFPQQKR